MMHLLLKATPIGNTDAVVYTLGCTHTRAHAHARTHTRPHKTNLKTPLHKPPASNTCMVENAKFGIKKSNKIANKLLDFPVHKLGQVECQH